MIDPAAPLPIDDDKTTPMPRQTMAEMVFDCATIPCVECDDEYTALELSEDMLCTACVNRAICGVCADRGTVHVPHDEGCASPFGDD